MLIDRYALLTDYYELTMANGYIETNMAEKHAIFDLFFRSAPFGGIHVVAYGISKAIEDIINMKFYEDDIEYLREQKEFSEDFLEYLYNYHCNLSIRSVEDGELVFPYEPIMQVEGPLIQCQMIETFLLNSFNFPSLCATKANRMWLTSNKGTLLEFGVRRAQGPNGGIAASEAAVVGGFSGTSNVFAGKKFGLSVGGTHAHSWIMSFDSELEAFRKYAQVYPENAILLVDTYDTLESGVVNAITVGKELEKQGHKLVGIRLDSGDLAYFSREARKMLDDSGLDYVKIVASSDIDEHVISELQKQDCKIDIYGIGTKVATCYDQPALGGVYKLSQIEDKLRLKISSNVEKMTIPGKKQLYRLYNGDGMMTGDVMELYEKGKLENGTVYDPLNPMRHYKVKDPARVEPLLQKFVENGEIIGQLKDWKAARATMKEKIDHFPKAHTRLLNPQNYRVSISEDLHVKRTKLIESLLEE